MSYLILKIKIGKSLKIGDDVTVTVLGFDRGYVKLGTEAPMEVQVHREEVYRRIKGGEVRQA